MDPSSPSRTEQERDMQTCTACHHSNAEHRGYCAACGHMMRQVCRTCRFANDLDDRFCGGCGLSLQMPVLSRTITGSKLPPPSATSAELDALFATRSSPPDDVLPAAGIGQDDIDRLCGARGTR
jgi:hypothetical protein